MTDRTIALDDLQPFGNTRIRGKTPPSTTPDAPSNRY